jgi:hypothetical protein
VHPATATGLRSSGGSEHIRGRWVYVRRCTSRRRGGGKGDEARPAVGVRSSARLWRPGRRTGPVARTGGRIALRSRRRAGTGCTRGPETRRSPRPTHAASTGPRDQDPPGRRAGELHDVQRCSRARVFSRRHEAGPLNGDRILDLVVTATDRDVVDVLLGSAGAVFVRAEGSPFAASERRYTYNKRSLHLLDVDEDGYVDIVTANRRGQFAFPVLLGNGRGRFARGPVLTVPPLGRATHSRLAMSTATGASTP